MKKLFPLRFSPFIYCVLICGLLCSFSPAYARKSAASENGNTAKASGESVEEAEKDFSGMDLSTVLASDATAIDFLEGYWTNGRSDYIYAARGDGELISWQMNLPYPACNQYILTDGVLTGKVLNTRGDVDDYEIFRMEIVDENTLKVLSFYTEEETTFIRDRLSVDVNDLRDEYVFWSMDRASLYLEGEWMSPGLDYIAVSNENGFQMSTSIPCPVGTEIGFCDLEMCAITVDQSNGKKTFEKAYRFSILGKDAMTVHCYENDTDYTLCRISAEIDPENLDPSYVFYCDSRAHSFLMGTWKEKNGDGYFQLFRSEEDISWKTNLPYESHASYTYADGGLIGLDYDEQNKLIQTKIYEFDIFSRDEITIHILSDDSVHTLIRTD